MLKNLATRTTPTVLDDVELGRLAPSPEVSLTLAQRRMVDRLRAAGAAVKTAELVGADLRTLRALEKKGLVRSEGEGDDATFILVDLMVDTTDPEDDDGSMSTEEFREALQEAYGYGGQSRLARVLGKDTATVGKWAQGKLSVPLYAANHVRMALYIKANRLDLPDFA